MNSEEIRKKYTTVFGNDPEIMIVAPGRINVIGEHTDYNMGFVLPAAVDKYMYFAIGRSGKDHNLDILSANFDQLLNIENLREIPEDAPSWLKYIITSIQLLESSRGVNIEGLQVVFGGNIPVGSGMSSSAALCCGFLYGLADLFDLDIKKKEIALLAQKTEHTIGINCGLMDQYASLFGKEEMVMLLDCQNLEYNHFPLSMDAHAFMLVNSMVQHELAAESGYNDRRKSCEDTVAILRTKGENVESLRDVTKEMLQKHQAELEDIAFRRCLYVIEENHRVGEVVRFLKEGKINKASQVLYAAHAGMRNDYQITIEEIDFLVDLTKEVEGVLGARMMGGGFGGCTINLIEKVHLENIQSVITTRYKQKYNITPEIYMLNLSDGIHKQ